MVSKSMTKRSRILYLPLPIIHKLSLISVQGKLDLCNGLCFKPKRHLHKGVCKIYKAILGPLVIVEVFGIGPSHL